MSKKKSPKAVNSALVSEVASATSMPAEVSLEGECQVAHMKKGELIQLILFFAVVLAATMIATGRAAIIVMLLFLAFSVRKSSITNLGEHLCLPAIGVFCMALLYGISAIYSPFGESAVLELYRGMATFSIAGFALLCFRKKDVPALLWGFIIVSTIFAFISLDMGASRLLFDPLAWLIELCEGNVTEFEPVAGGRLSGLFNNANVLAALTAFPMLLGLYQLTDNEKGRREKLLASLCLGINAVTFWLCLSRGALLCFGVTLLVYLLLTKKGERVRLFLLMLICVVVTVILGSVASGFLGIGSLLPNILALICGPVIYLLDALVSVRVANVLAQHQKAMLVSGGVLAVCVAVFAVCAMTITGSYTFSGDNAIVGRSVSLAGGQTYTVSGDWSGDVQLKVWVEEKDGLLMDWGTTVYEGSLAGAKFTLPEKTATVMLTFTGSDGDELRNVTFSDGTSVKLNRVLLPEVLEGRMQDSLLTSSSLLLRVQYIKDGLKIWATAPLFGRGLTSTDNLYTSVQPVYYQSKFAHCHVVQYLADLGILGFGCFLMITVGLVWLLLRKRKENGDPLAAVFLSCILMLNIHSFMEINLSIRAYAIMAYFLMAIMMLAFGEPVLVKGKRSVKRAAAAAAAGMWLTIVTFAGITISFRAVDRISASYETTNLADFMHTLDKFIAFDAINDDYYKILYLSNSFGYPEFSNNAEKYAKELRDSGTFTNCDAVARYFYLPAGRIEALFACSMEGIAQKAADTVAWDAEFDFYRARVMTAFQNDWENAEMPFIEGVLRVRDYLASWNEGRMEQIVLSEENQAFVEAVEKVWKDPEMTPEESYSLLSQYSYAESES